MPQPRKPTAIKKAEGNRGKKALPKNEPQPEIKIPECPEHLDDIAKAEWNRLTPELLELGLISEVDRSALAAYCQSYSRWITAENHIADSGMTTFSPNGHEMVSPFVSIANKAMENMRKFLIEFGLTPASRSGVTTNTAKKTDPLTAFLNRQKTSKKRRGSKVVSLPPTDATTK